MDGFLPHWGTGFAGDSKEFILRRIGAGGFFVLRIIALLEVQEVFLTIAAKRLSLITLA